MGTMFSHLEDLDRLSFDPFPSRPVAMKKIVRIGDHQLIGIGENGKLYATGSLAKNAAFLPADWNWLDDVLAALVKLGVVSQSVADAHADRCKKLSASREAKYYLSHAVSELKERYGVILTPSQLLKIEAVANQKTH